VLLERRRAGIDHHVILVIDDALEIASSHVEDQTDARGHAFEEPDMADRYGELDMAHALAANAGERHFDTAAVANNAAMFDPLILSAGAFPVLYGAENTLAEQAAFFRLEGAVIDGFGVFDFPFGPGADRVGRGHRNGHVFDL